METKDKRLLVRGKEMRKLLYVACVDLDDAHSGISRKVITQYRCLGNAFDATLIGYSGENVMELNGVGKQIHSSERRRRRNDVIQWAKQYSQKNDAFDVYIRRMPCNRKIMDFLKTLKKNGAVKILWEIPTYPYDNEKKNIIAEIHLLFDKIYRRGLPRYVDRIVTFAPETCIFNIPTIHTGNGIDVDSLRPRAVRELDDHINFIGVAVLNHWHGYDRLIRGLADYQGKTQAIFHLVGDGPCLQEYKELTKELGVQDRVIFYGAKTKEEIEDIYDCCDIAVESLGWHRSNVTTGTSIKTREYIAKGMPILASSPMDIFPEGWEFAYYAPIDDTPINIQKVVEFYESLLQNQSAEELARRIREIAYERCDMKKMMQPVVECFKEG